MRVLLKYGAAAHCAWTRAYDWFENFFGEGLYVVLS